MKKLTPHCMINYSADKRFNCTKIKYKEKKMRIINLVLILTVLLFPASCSSGSLKDEGNITVSKAPDFTLPDQDGKSITLKSLLENRKGAVLAFYPKDDSKN